MVIQIKEIVQVVTFLYRYYFKATGSIVYHVRSENAEYCVTVNQNGTTGCYNRETGEECPGHKYAYKRGHDCHHVVDCQRRERERAERPAADWYIGLDGQTYLYGEEQETITLIEEPYQRIETDEDARTQQWMDELALTHAQSDEAYEAWKRENSLDNTMSREAYVSVYDPCGMEA